MSRQSVVIVGGGIVGLCTAHFLLESGYQGRIQVVERDWSHSRSSTARSVAAIRQQFRLRENVELSRFGNDFFAAAESRLGRDIGYQPATYLVLSGPDGTERMRQAAKVQQEAGADVVMLEAVELSARFPWLRVDDLAVGILSLSGEGWIDPVKTLYALRDVLAAHPQVELVSGTVVRFQRDGDSISQLLLGDGRSIHGDVFVNAAGPGAGRLMRDSGLPIPIESRKRCAFVFESPRAPPGYPCLVDPTVAHRSVFSRPYGDRFLAVTSPDPQSDPETDDLRVDRYLFEEVIRPGLAHRIDGFDRLALVGSWAGHYELNTFDQNAFVGPHHEATNLFLNCGFSGHGVMHAPGAARGLAELLSGGRFESLDLGRFSLDRVAHSEPLDDLQPSERREIQSGI